MEQQVTVKEVVETAAAYLRDHGLEVKYTVIYGGGKKTLALVLDNVKAEAVLQVGRDM